MEQLFSVMAWAGGILTTILLGLTLFGLDHGDIGDLDHGMDHDQGQGLNLLSLRALSTAVAVFGLVGLALYRAEVGVFITVLGAALAALVGAFLIAWTMRWFTRAESDGSINLETAIGTAAKVAVPVPALSAGVGKIILTIQNHLIECPATNSSAAVLPTGSSVVITGLSAGEVFEVVPYPQDPEVSL